MTMIGAVTALRGTNRETNPAQEILEKAVFGIKRCAKFISRTFRNPILHSLSLPVEIWGASIAQALDGVTLAVLRATNKAIRGFIMSNPILTSAIRASRIRILSDPKNIIKAIKAEKKNAEETNRRNAEHARDNRAFSNLTDTVGL